jgi:hypothetical protein
MEKLLGIILTFHAGSWLENSTGRVFLASNHYVHFTTRTQQTRTQQTRTQGQRI